MASQRLLKRFAAPALLAGLLPLAAHAAGGGGAYPAKPVEVVVPWTPGQATDIAARALTEHLTTAMGKSFFITNKPGAGGAVGSAAVARAPADGYTLLAGSTGSVVVSPLLNETNYTADDFVPAAMIAKSPSILITATSFPAKNVQELIALLKKNPGKYSFASSGNGSATHLMAEAFNLGYGIQATHVPYKGSSAAMTDLVTGRVDYMFDTVASVAGQVKAGKVRAYAISSKDRSAAMPDVPAIAEVTELKDFDIASWIGLMAPKGTPQDVLDRIAAASQKYLETPAAREKFLGMGLAVSPMDNARFKQVADGEVDLYSKLLKQLGLARQ
ncbi:tripartite tricarboxylate transporter substrate binding protein [Pigmentiphaga soli]|uniref:Tripartite tricarboxylate transporter substrate binding protein n=1 Tax=Pigmentiphaga soli TaxID=1007095 RepID=A0ABP8GFK6_9BURK